MKLRNFGTAGLGCFASLVSIAIDCTPTLAQAAYGSYVGVGGSLGLGEETRGGGTISARYKLLELPLSIRAQALIGNGVAIVPTVSYDIPVNWQTDIYIGSGVSVVTGGSTPVGDKTSFVIQPGVDYAIPNSDLVVFGNAIVAFDAYRDKGGTAFAIQAGMGLQF